MMRTPTTAYEHEKIAGMVGLMGTPTRQDSGHGRPDEHTNISTRANRF